MFSIALGFIRCRIANDAFGGFESGFFYRIFQGFTRRKVNLQTLDIVGCNLLFSVGRASRTRE